MKDTKKIEQAASLEELFERLDRVIGGLEGESFQRRFRWSSFLL